MAGNVPIARSLNDIYTPDAIPGQKKRWEHLLSTFESNYGHPPTFVARSPGRVNVIGEHIDYSLYSVLPMGITADAIIAVSHSVELAPPSATSFKIRISNVLAEKFPAHEFDIPFDKIDIDATKHEWTNYFKGGMKGALELLKEKRGAEFRPKSMDVLMDGIVPAGGGLSSSAAFLSCSALAVLIANGEESVDKTELTELAIVSERAVGVNAGGMDQSASVLSIRGSALYVSFHPALTARPVHFPKTNPDLSFVIANSFVAADKFVTGPIHYNLRVVECSIAAAYLHALVNKSETPLPPDAGPLGISLWGFHSAYFSKDSTPKSLEEQLSALIKLTESTFTKEEGYTREEVSEVLKISIPELEQRYTSKFPIRAERFKLRQRTLHVFNEALRVLQFVKLLEHPDEFLSKDPGDSTESYNKKLGELMNQSQDSCRDLYGCSCEELDELCQIARKAGSYGSRLTGAGWGGCSVHLVPSHLVDAVTDAWDKQYYSKKTLKPGQKESAVVVSRPGGGSAVFMVGGTGVL